MYTSFMRSFSRTHSLPLNEVRIANGFCSRHGKKDNRSIHSDFLCLKTLSRPLGASIWEKNVRKLSSDEIKVQKGILQNVEFDHIYYTCIYI